MSEYIKHTWADDEVITADKLNNIETGIAEAKKAAEQTDLSAHNTSTTAHADLRAELKALSNRINAALDSDDTTLDELSEIVAYIKSNKSLIDAITISKVNVADIVNDLVTNVTNKPLSAAQGVVLKGLIDTLQTAVNGKAAASHGYHVPTPEVANDTRFLRNDNTWQRVLPSEIGAAKDYHTHLASEITGGTFSERVHANRGAYGQSPTDYLVRNSKLATAEENPTVNGEICWTYE